MENKENGFDVLFWGDWALFTNPLTMLSGSKYSYAVPTLSAIKGMMKAIYWKPAIEWEIESIEILKQIRRETKNMLLQADKYQSSQRGTNNYLKDVAYRVKAHLAPSQYTKQFAQDQGHGLRKHAAIAHSRFSKGSGYQVPVLGVSECRAFTCETKQAPEKIDSSYYRDKELCLDVMLLDIVYPTPADQCAYRVFWTPVVENGIIEFPTEMEIRRAIQLANNSEPSGYIVEKLPPESYIINHPWWMDSEEPVMTGV